MSLASILVVDDRPSVCEFVASILGRYEVATSTSGSQAIKLIGSAAFDVIVTDVCMPGANGYEVLLAAKDRSLSTQVVLMTAYGTVSDAVAAMKQGAFDYIQKPFDPDDVLLAVAHALQATGSGTCAGGRRNEAEAVEQTSQPRVAVTMPYRKMIDAARARASRDYLAAILREFGGNVTRTAERAGMERENLHRLLRRFGLRAEDFRHPRPS